MVLDGFAGPESLERSLRRLLMVCEPVGARYGVSDSASGRRRLAAARELELELLEMVGGDAPVIREESAWSVNGSAIEAS